jgi:hypothetical protein
MKNRFLAGAIASMMLAVIPVAAFAAPEAPSKPLLSNATLADATTSEAQLRVTWTASIGPNLVGHTVSLTSAAGSIQGAESCQGTACSATFSNLIAGTSYVATVTAVDESGAGTPASSDPRVAVTAPAAPTSLAVSPDGANLTLSWAPPSNTGGQSLTSYVISAPDSGFVEQSVPGTQTTFTAANLNRGQTYAFQVRAVNSFGTSVAARASAVAPTTPDAPSAPTVTVIGQKVTVTWSEPDNRGSQIESYVVTLLRGGVVAQTDSNVTSATTTKEFVVATTGSYQAKVAARNGIGLGLESPLSQAATVTSGSQLLSNNPSLDTPAPSSLSIGTTAQLSANAPSGEPVQIRNTTSQFCALSGTTVRALAEGTCVIRVSAAATDTYDAGLTLVEIEIVTASLPGAVAVIAPPVLDARPRLSGSAKLGEFLVASPGSWQNQSGLEFKYRWFRCDAELSNPSAIQAQASCELVAGASLFNYLVGALDEGSHILVEVTALNSSGLSTTSYSSTVFFGTEAVTPSAGEPAYWPKKLSDNSIKLYAKNIVGVGKVQFFLNGKEIAWVRAVDETDPKLRKANGFNYLVRTVNLKAGMKNAVEIYVDGERVRRAAYTVR